MTTRDTAVRLPISKVMVGHRHRRDMGDLAGLASSISQVGLLHPVVVTPDGQLIAGVRRLAACRDHLGWTEIPCWVVDLKQVLLGEAAENAVRKNLLPSEQIALGAAVEKLERKAAKERQGTRTDLQHRGKLPRSDAGKTRDKVAAYVGSSGRTYEKAAAVVEAAKADPETFEPIVQRMDRSGKVDLAFRQVKQLKAKQHREAMAQFAPADPNLVTGDFRECGDQVADASADLVLTDPPYASDGVAMLGDLGIFAARALKPGGLCLIYSGQYYLPQVYAALSHGLSYMWTFCIYHSGGEQRFRKYSLRVRWKPVIAFYRPPLDAWWEPFSDVLSGGREKDHHQWQQAEAEAAELIERLCPKGGLVVDPFAGSGTTLVAAKRLRRTYFGFERDADTAAAARGRISQ